MVYYSATTNKVTGERRLIEVHAPRTLVEAYVYLIMQDIGRLDVFESYDDLMDGKPQASLRDVRVFAPVLRGVKDREYAGYFLHLIGEVGEEKFDSFILYCQWYSEMFVDLNGDIPTYETRIESRYKEVADAYKVLGVVQRCTEGGI